MDAGVLRDVVGKCFEEYGLEETADFLDKIKDSGIFLVHVSKMMYRDQECNNSIISRVSS